MGVYNCITQLNYHHSPVRQPLTLCKGPTMGQSAEARLELWCPLVASYKCNLNCVLVSRLLFVGFNHFPNFNWGEPERVPHSRVCCGILCAYICHTSCCKSLPALCAFLHHSLIHKLFTNYSVRRHEPSTSLMAIARSETTREPTYSMARATGATHHMAKRLHLSMPLFALTLTVEVTCHMDQPLQWPH